MSEQHPLGSGQSSVVWQESPHLSQIFNPVSKPAHAHEITRLQRAGAFFGGGVLKLLARTLRVKYEDRANAYEPAREKPLIACVWHNRLLGLLLADYRIALRHRPAKVLTSASKDGGWIAAMCRRFDLGAARGSSSRRGAAALLDLSRALSDGVDVIITPDGPRGPNYQIAPGIIQLASHAKTRVLPVKISISRFWRVGKKWDALWIPKPFARVEVAFLESIEVSGDASALDQEIARLTAVMGRD